MDLLSEASSSGTNPFAAADAPPVPLSTILTLNIYSQVPVTLEIVPPNYTLWLSFFTAPLQSFTITDHVDGTVDARSRRYDYAWTHVDWCIVRWLYETVSKEVVATIRQENPTAYVLWTSICRSALYFSPTATSRRSRRSRSSTASSRDISPSRNIALFRNIAPSSR